MGKFLLLLAGCAVNAMALPHYYTPLDPGLIGFGTMILNASGTGAAVDIFGSLPSGTPKAFTFIGGAIVFNDTANFTAPDFDFNGTIYFAGPCCGSFTVDTLGIYGGTWIFDALASGGGGGSGGAGGIDYSTTGTPPADLATPEPSTFVLMGLGLLTLLRRRQ